MGLRGPGCEITTHRKLHGRKRRKKPIWENLRLNRVDRVIHFIENLPITKGIYVGKKMRLLPNQRAFVEAIYGRENGDGCRTIRLAIKSEPRGNGKTGLLAALALCHLVGPECEVRGEIYSCAYNKLQAALIFEEMKAIIMAVPELGPPKVNIQRQSKRIEVLEGRGIGSIYESLSADDKRAHGLSPSLWIYDEFAQAPNTDLLDNLKTAMGKRKESLGVIISTQAANDMHPLSRMIDDAKQGTDPSVFLQLSCAPPDADIFDENTWLACNEALGKFLSLQEFRDQAGMAERMISFRAKFQNLRLNQRIDATTQFIDDPTWMACGKKLDFASLRDKPCFAGLDLSATTDMSALVLYWPHNGAVLPFFWLPEEGLLDRDRKEGGHYRTWKQSDLLETTPGAAINFKAIIRRLQEISHSYKLVQVAYDRHFIKIFKAQCEELSVDLPLRDFGQGFISMSPAVQLLEAAVRDKKIHHGGHPILRWQISNSAIEIDPAGNRKITKKRSTGHVDGVVALLMAMGVSQLKTENPSQPFMLFM